MVRHSRTFFFKALWLLPPSSFVCVIHISKTTYSLKITFAIAILSVRKELSYLISYHLSDSKPQHLNNSVHHYPAAWLKFGVVWPNHRLRVFRECRQTVSTVALAYRVSLPKVCFQNGAFTRPLNSFSMWVGTRSFHAVTCLSVPWHSSPHSFSEGVIQVKTHVFPDLVPGVTLCHT